MLLVVARTAVHVGGHRHPGLEPGEAERELGEDQQRHRDHGQRAPVLLGEGGPPVADHLRVLDDVPDAGAHDDEVEREVHDHQCDGDADRLGEPAQEDDPEERHQSDGDGQLLAVQDGRDVRVLHHVGRGVRSGERDGDDEVGAGEAQEHQHEELAAPEREQPFEHGDRPLAVGALGGHPAVDGERAEERHQDEHDRGDRGQGAGGEGRDARLVAEGREVVDTGQAHDLPPRVPFLGAVLPGVRREVLARGRGGAGGEEPPGHASRTGGYVAHTSMQPPVRPRSTGPDNFLTRHRPRPRIARGVREPVRNRLRAVRGPLETWPGDRGGACMDA